MEAAIEYPENTATPKPDAPDPGRGISAAVWVPAVITILAAFMWVFSL